MNQNINELLEYAKMQARLYQQLAYDQDAINKRHDERHPLLKDKKRYELLVAEHLHGMAYAYKNMVEKLIETDKA